MAAPEAARRVAQRERRLHRRRSHEGKVPFADEAAAEAAARRMGAELPGHEFNAYKCEHCEWWHVGHVPLWKGGEGCR